jgi:hypothetical protein
MELVWDSHASAPEQANSNINSNSTHTCKWARQLTVSNCNEVFCFLEDFSILVCKQHCTAIVSLDAHLRKHHAASATLRQQIVKCFNHFNTVTPSTVELPDEPAQAIEELGEPLDGAQCKTCRWITINKDQMRMHCKKKHQQAWTGDRSLLYSSVKVQSFFRTGGLQRYFIVDPAEGRDVENTRVGDCVQAQLAEYKLTQQEVKKELETLSV